MSKSPRQPKCTCPACDGVVGAVTCAVADGVFYCVIDREWAAYSANQFIGAYEYQAQALEALAVYEIDQAAAEADMTHDVQQAAADSDVVAAIGPYTADLCDVCGCNKQNMAHADAYAKRHDYIPHSVLPEYPAFLYYDRNQGGVVWAGSPTAYPSFVEAALARDGK